jgi:hypothetical protein
MSLLACITLAPALLLAGGETLGDCPSSFYSWTPPTTPTAQGPASAPANDTVFSADGGSTAYFAQGTTLLAVRNIAEPGCALGDCSAGGIKWTWQAPAPSTIANFPSPVPLSAPGAGEFVFLAAGDGFLYKIDAAAGTTSLAVDTRRDADLGAPTCPTDTLIATPAVQLYNFSNGSFTNDVDAVPGHVQDDVVYVITRDECADTTRNRVIAYWASNLALKWTFNASGAYLVDFGGEGGAIDYDTNTLYFGTNLEPGVIGQDSLWAISSLDGGLNWAGNAGSIHNRPALANGRLYVANLSGEIMAYDPGGDPTNPGAAVSLWANPVQMPSLVTRNIWPEFRGGPFHGNILALDVAGTLRALMDAGGSGQVLWDTTAEPGVTFRSMPVVFPSANKAFIGRDDGRVQQIDLALGAPEGTLQVAPAPADVYDPSLDVEGGAPDINRLIVAAGGMSGTNGMITRVNVPLCATPPPGLAAIQRN